MNWCQTAKFTLLVLLACIPHMGYAQANTNNPYCTHPPPCWEPIDDPSMWMGGECCRPNDHVVNDCIRKYEEEFSNNNQCMDQWRVYWNERFGFTPPGGVGTGGGSLWYRQPEVVMERVFYSVYICITESEVCENGEIQTKTDDGVFARQEIYRRQMEVVYGEWEPYVKITIHWFFGQYTIERPPRRPPRNPLPCNWKEVVPCVCP